MMQVYAQVAGLSRRYMLVLPFLTPTIASLWVGTVTPIPSGLARPLVESLECDAVMRNWDVNSIIEPPPDGLIGYRRAVELALHRAGRGLPDATWSSSEPADPLPSDPDWAGEIVYTNVQTATTAAGPGDVWSAARDATTGGRRRHLPLRGWSVEESDPGVRLRLRSTARLAGRAWLEITVHPQDGGGSRYTQRAIFLPSGTLGRMHRIAVWPLRAVALGALAREIVAAAGG